jgi:peptidoglycan hydrolase-like protein with peptidoglycan-binding domain
VPEHLRIRFLNYDETPRVEVPYLLSLTRDKNILVADISSETDDKGFLDQPIPPSALFATITLNPGPWPEVFKLNLGHTDPIDELTGWQTRLNNLGYDCGGEDGILGENTRLAICAFQRSKQIPETGNMEPSTQAALLALALS